MSRKTDVVLYPCMQLYAFDEFLRRVPIIPIKPKPVNANIAGSGTSLAALMENKVGVP
jgi:hypothetical protein